MKSKINNIKFTSLMIISRLIRATAFPLAVLSTFQYLPNVLLDMLLPLINATLNVHMQTGFSSIDFGSLDLWDTNNSVKIIINTILLCCWYGLNFFIVSFLVNGAGELLESSVIRHRLGPVCFKRYKSLVLKKKATRENKWREYAINKYGNSTSTFGILMRMLAKL